MISLYVHFAFTCHRFLQRHAPTNKLLRAVRTRTGPPWLPVATLLASVGYFAATEICAVILESGGPGWVNLLMLVFCWNAIKLGGRGAIGLGMQGVTRLLPPPRKSANASSPRP